MQACKYNTKEFATFTSGKKKIKPQPTDDWRVTTGGFKNSNDVLNLTSAKLGQTVYDIGSHSFFRFMKDENVTMNGDKIVGSFAIGTQRVLRKESDYHDTMSKITERKSTIIAKKDMIPGHEYETVCGSTFIFAGTRYFVKSVINKSGIKTTQNKKYYLSYIDEKYYKKVQDVTSKKVVKDLGLKKDKEFLDNEIEKYIKKEKILFSSETLEKIQFELTWEETHENLNDGYNRITPDYIINTNGFVFQRVNNNWKVQYKLLQENDKGILVTIDTNDITYDSYDDRKALVDYKSVVPKWVKIKG